MLELVPVLGVFLVWILPIVLIWWMVRTLNSIRIDVRRIADGIAREPEELA